MKTLTLIYNPFAGDKSFRYALDACVQAFQDGGYAVRLHRMKGGDAAEAVAALDDDCRRVIAAGGDGTLNQVADALLRQGRDIPLGIIPAGTANDFAGYLKMPTEPGEAARAIMDGRVIRADAGRINGRYFINVCGAGLFTNISHQVDKQFKDSLGMLAYYLKGIEQLPRFMPFYARITTPDAVWEESLYLFVALNGCGAGGFNRLSPYSRIDDGLLDFIALRAVSFRELAVLLVKVMRGDFLDDESVIFLRERRFTVELLSHETDAPYYVTDVDGERGPNLPVHIECLPDALPLIVPDTYR